MFNLRISQGWTIPESHRGNWIERLKKKRVEEYNNMSVYKRLLWQMGLFENPNIENLDPERARLSRVLDYSPYKSKNRQSYVVLNGGSKKNRKNLRKKKNRSRKFKNRKLRN